MKKGSHESEGTNRGPRSLSETTTTIIVKIDLKFGKKHQTGLMGNHIQNSAEAIGTRKRKVQA